MVLLYNLIPAILVFITLLLVYFLPRWKPKVIAGVIMVFIYVLYGMAQPSYGPKGVVKKAPHVETTRTITEIEDRLSKPKSLDERKQILENAYKEIDAKVEHLKP